MDINLSQKREMEKSVVEEMDKYSGSKPDEDISKLIKKAKQTIAGKINADENKLLFYSEDQGFILNLINGIAKGNKDKNEIIIPDLEYNPEELKDVEKNGFKIIQISSDKDGFVNLDELDKTIDRKTLFVAINHVNRDLGTVQDIKKIGDLCRKQNVLLFINANNSFSKIEINLSEINVDYLAISTKKIHGPDKIICIYSKEETHFGEENLNLSEIVGFQKAIERFSEFDTQKIVLMRNHLIDSLLNEIGEINLNGPKGESRICDNVNISFLPMKADDLKESLLKKGIKVSKGDKVKLMACGIDEESAGSSIIFNISKFNTDEEIETVINTLVDVVEELRRDS